MNARLVRFWILMLAAAMGVTAGAPGRLWGQDEAPEAAESRSAAPAGAAGPAGAEGSARERFDAAVDALRGPIKELFEQMVRWHSDALDEPERRTQLRRGELEQRARAAVDEAFAAATELVEDDLEGYREATIFLMQAVLHRGRTGRYEETGPAAAALLAAGEALNPLLEGFDATRGELARVAGVSFFATNDFDRAEQYLREAQTAGALEDKDFGYLAMIDEYREHWRQEREMRERDAAAGDLPRVRFRTTRGDVVAELFEDQAPKTVANFVALVDRGFYEEMPFYQVISEVMAMTGDPIGDGTGDAGYRIPDEADHPEARRIFRGSLVMAKIPANESPQDGRPTTVPDSASSQFFFSFLPLPGADAEHTVFGRVIEGMDTLAALNRLDPTAEKEEVQQQPDMLLETEVLRRRDHPYEPPATARDRSDSSIE